VRQVSTPELRALLNLIDTEFQRRTQAAKATVASINEAIAVKL
jgi:hypothetical protein